MEFAVVTVSLLDMWGHPKYNSERVSQLLFGNPIKVLKKSNGFALVSQPDGYTGWVDQRFILRSDRKYFDEFENKCRYVISRESARVFNKSGYPCDPYIVYYGTKLSISKSSRGFVLCSIPSLLGKYLKRSVISPIISIKRRSVDVNQLKREAKKFLGRPYLWGGVTPAGFDCSAFVRALFGRFGISLPRDTRDQIGWGTKIGREDIKSGDLLFFERHVAMAMGKLRYIHCSRGGGGIRINSLHREAEDYLPDLDNEFKMARRIL